MRPRFRFQSVFTLAIAVVFASALGAYAQENSAIPLLPERLGPMESLLWSERGAMRRVFDFPLTLEGREKELGTRRTFLGLHQLGGFATFAAMAATIYIGQKVYNGEEDLSQIHKAMAFTTVGTYFTTASLAAFAPPPLIRRKQWSTVSTHKFLANFHLAGMLAMPVLGLLVKDGRDDLRATHMAVGYATLTAFGAAMLVVTF